MRPVSVSVGPLAAASADNIAAAQTPAEPGILAMTGALATSAAIFTASIAGNVLTVTAVASGFMFVGMKITGPGLTFPFTIIGFRTGTGGAGTYVLDKGTSIPSRTMYGEMIATLDKPRRVLITTVADESASTITINGTGPTGNVQSETMAGPNATSAYTDLDYSTITSIVVSDPFTGTVSAGTNGVASSKWVRFDDWAPGQVGLQCDVSGTANYTIQTSFDDPNSVESPTLVEDMNWVASQDANVVGATTNQQSNFAFAPTFARVLLNSGDGSVSATFLQSSNGPA